MSLIPLRERHIDRVLSEELEASPEFAAWFAHRVFGGKCPIEPPSCSTTIGHNRVGGETDILVQLTWPSGKAAVIHVEDKIEAVPRHDQALRYSAAVDTAECDVAASALVAPRDWINRHRREAFGYDATITLEEIADHLRARADLLESSGNTHAKELMKRLRWREQLLSGAMQRRAVYRALQASELIDWNRAAAEVIAATNGLMLIVGERQRSEGRNQASRFFRFVERLSPYQDGRSPLIQLKTAEARTPGRVSIEVRSASQDTDLHAEATQAGLHVKVTKAGTLIISDTTERLKMLTIAEPVASQIRLLEDAASVTQKLIEWWEARQGASAS